MQNQLVVVNPISRYCCRSNKYPASDKIYMALLNLFTTISTLFISKHHGAFAEISVHAQNRMYRGELQGILLDLCAVE